MESMDAHFILEKMLDRVSDDAVIDKKRKQESCYVSRARPS